MLFVFMSQLFRLVSEFGTMLLKEKVQIGLDVLLQLSQLLAQFVLLLFQCEVCGLQSLVLLFFTIDIAFRRMVVSFILDAFILFEIDFVSAFLLQLSKSGLVVLRNLVDLGVVLPHQLFDLSRVLLVDLRLHLILDVLVQVLNLLVDTSLELVLVAFTSGKVIIAVVVSLALVLLLVSLEVLNHL